MTNKPLRVTRKPESVLAVLLGIVILGCILGYAIADAQVKHPKSASLFKIKLCNGRFNRTTYGEFVQWVDSELKKNNAEKTGFKKAVLENGVNPDSELNLTAEFPAIELGDLLKESNSIIRSGWKYERGILTFIPYESREWTFGILQLDSPLLEGIDFSNEDVVAVKDAIDERMYSLGFRSIVADSSDISAKWNIEVGFLGLSMINADWEAAYSLDRLMRLGSRIYIEKQKHRLSP